MVVKEFNNAQAYLDDYESNLLQNEPVSQLILFNAYKNKNKATNEDELFGTVLDKEEAPVLHFANIPPYNLTLYVENEDKEKVKEATEHLVKHLVSNNITILGLNSRYEVGQLFINEYKKYVDCTFIEKLGMDIMVIRQSNDIKPAEGMTRLATIDEVKIITDWMIQFQIEARASEINYEDALHKAKRFIEDNKVYVFENTEQELVSMAIITRELVHGVAISNVFTPEKYRGIGYAATNIFYMCTDLFARV